MANKTARVPLRLSILAILVAILTLSVGLSAGSAAQPEEQALVKIAVRGETDLRRIEATGLPIFSRLAGPNGGYLLAGVPQGRMESLRASGLAVDLLDPTTLGATYYLVGWPAGLPLAPTVDPSAILSRDGDQTVVRMEPADAERLASDGAELVRLQLEPIALHPRREQATTVQEAQPISVVPDPLVADLLAQVDTADLLQYERWLSGGGGSGDQQRTLHHHHATHL